MDLNKYQEEAKKFRVEGAPPEERVMGMLEEAGEIAGVFKRLIRGDYTALEAEQKLFKECGDVFWYLSQIVDDNGWTLNQVAASNIEKLESRKLRNVLMGKGDDR